MVFKNKLLQISFLSKTLLILCNITKFAGALRVKILQIRILQFWKKYDIIYKLDVR